MRNHCQFEAVLKILYTYTMRRLFFTLGTFLLVSLFFVTPTYAQNSCAEILSVNSSISDLDITQNTEFTCTVTVSQPFAGSRWIACGVSINGSWPLDLCSSQGAHFGGWQGNRATFNCAIPANMITTSDKVELTGFDFSSSCGIDGAQYKELHFRNSRPEPTTGPGTPQPTRPSQSPPARGDVCSVFRNAMRSCNTDIDCLVEFIRSFLNQGSTGTQPTPTPPPAAQPPVAGAYSSWLQLYNEVSQKTGVPAGFLRAIKEVETTGRYNDATTLNQYSQPGTALPREQCSINNCGAAGPMQMTTDKDDQGDPTCPRCGNYGCPNSWNVVVNDIHQYTGGTPNYCNIRDNVYGSAMLLKRCNAQVNGHAEKWDTDDSIVKTMKCYGGPLLQNATCGERINRVAGGRLTYCEWVLCNIKGTC